MNRHNVTVTGVNYFAWASFVYTDGTVVKQVIEFKLKKISSVPAEITELNTCFSPDFSLFKTIAEIDTFQSCTERPLLKLTWRVPHYAPLSVLKIIKN
jgi:hypothetical protein